MTNTTLSINLVANKSLLTNSLIEYSFNSLKTVTDTDYFLSAVEYNYFTVQQTMLEDKIESTKNKISTLLKKYNELIDKKCPDAVELQERMERNKVSLEELKEQLKMLDDYYQPKFIDTDKDIIQGYNNDLTAKSMVLTFFGYRPIVSGLNELYGAITTYYDKYTGTEEWIPERKEDFRLIKNKMADILQKRFGNADNAHYKKHTVKLTSAFVEDCINFVYGDTKRDKANNLETIRKPDYKLYIEMLKKYISKIEYKNEAVTSKKSNKTQGFLA